MTITSQTRSGSGPTTDLHPEKETGMLIQVLYPNGKYDMVKDFFLSALIEQDQILSFKRQDGWISIGSPQVRRKSPPDVYYFGPERRRNHHDAPSMFA